MIEQGAEKFEYQGEMHIAPTAAIVTVNPTSFTMGPRQVKTAFSIVWRTCLSCSCKRFSPNFRQPHCDIFLPRLPLILRSRDASYTPYVHSNNSLAVSLKPKPVFFRRLLICSCLMRNRVTSHTCRENPAVIRHACEFIRTRLPTIFVR